jgi:hypothetical protein
MKRKAPEEKEESAQSLVNHLSYDANSHHYYHSIQSIELYAAQCHPRNRDSGLVAEFREFRDIDCTKREVCTFLDTHTYVACIAIKYTVGRPLYQVSSPEAVTILTLDDGYQLSVDSEVCHVRTVPASSAFGTAATIRDLRDLVVRNKMTELQELVPKYFDVNTRSNGKTMLHTATILGHTRVIEWLVQQPGIEIDATDDTGATAFLWAAYCLSPNNMALLHRHGAFASAVDNWAFTALHEVVRMTMEHNMNEAKACLAFLGDHMPLVAGSRSLCPASSVKETVKQELYLVGRRVRDRVLGYVCGHCPVRVLADIIMQYWEGDISFLRIP